MIKPCDKPCESCQPAPSSPVNLGLSPNDQNNPFLNLSSEAPDKDLFVGRRPSFGDPLLGSTWWSVGCMGFCFSENSQEDADICAANQAFLCSTGGQPGGGGGGGGGFPPPFIPPTQPPAVVYYNNPKSCSFTCPDGSLFTYSVGYAYFYGPSQAGVDAMASSYACKMAAKNVICLGAFQGPAKTCLNAPYLGPITASNKLGPVVFSISAGSLPDGLSLNNMGGTTALIAGNPTVPGDYTFTIKATSSINASVEKTITLTVFGIVDASQLPDCTSGSPYSYTLSTAGTAAGPITYAIVSGSLPAGLTLNSSTGEISGTPTVDGAYQIVVTVTDGSITCGKVFDLYSQTASCFDWNMLVWNPPIEFSLTITALQNKVTSVIQPNPLNIANGSVDSVSVDYTGPACNAVCRLTISGVTGQVNYDAYIWDGFNGILDQAGSTITDLSGDFPFSLSGPCSFDVFVSFGADASNDVSRGTFTIELIPPP